MKKIGIFGLSLIFLSACGAEEASPANELCGYGEMMTVGGKEYLRLHEKQELTLDQPIGEILVKIDPSLHPVEELSSNSLAEGTDLFTVKNHEHFLVAKTEEDKYILFEELH
ncbi:hypothetical protein [Bacillus sp. AK031]